MGIFNQTQGATLLRAYLVKKFVPTLEKELQFQKFGVRASIPAAGGNLARWNTFSNPPATTTAIAEGSTTANEITLTTTKTEATVKEYGEFTPFSKLIELTGQSGTRENLVKRMAYGGALALDSIVRDGPGGVLGVIDTTKAFYCTAAAQGGAEAAATPLAGSAAAIIGASKVLRDDGVQGLTGISGHPDGEFAAIVTPKYELDMVTEGGTTRMTWARAVTNVPGSMGQEKWVKGYMGSVYGTAVYRTQNFTNTTVTVAANNNFVIGDHGYGCVDLGDANANVFVNTASAGDIGNPYRNRHTVAWHAFFASALLDAAASHRVVRLYSAG